jgi:hypothetical protein
VASESPVKGELHVFGEIVENLRLSKSPETEEDQENRCPFGNLKGKIVKLLIVHWRLGVVVNQQDSFTDIHIEEGEDSNGEQDGQGGSKHEGHEDSVEDSSILEMHRVLWSRVEVHVLGNSSSLTLVRTLALIILVFTAAATALIQTSE